MPVDVDFTDDPAVALDTARTFLESDPLRHNVICTLLEARSAARTPIRFWTATVDGKVTGAVFQSPDVFPALVSRLEDASVEALARAVADVPGAAVPGVNGLAQDAARFAGEFATVTRRPGRAVEGQRLYEVREVVAPATVTGAGRIATQDDAELVATWSRGFGIDTGLGDHSPSDSTEHADRLVASGRLHLWESHGERTTSTFASPPAAGVVRVGFVYTPPEHRRQGYASALVAAVSSKALAGGHRCILYTQLENPTSNAIYQRLGYRPIGEIVRYAFD